MEKDNLHIFDTPDLLLPALADFFIACGTEAIKQHGTYTVALSGGSSPQKLYTLLASEKYRGQIAWDKILFFFGDERFVPADDIQSNYRMAKESLFTPLNIAEKQIFPVNTTVSPEQSAVLYEEAIKKHVGPSGTFDMILLGLGDNSHTASLFPHTAVLSEKMAWVKEEFVKEVNQYRITLTAPLINLGRTIVFLVYGAGKADAVHHILKDPYQPEEFPAQLIMPVNGVRDWFLDKAAAQRIQER